MAAGRILFDHVWKRFHRGPAHDSLRDLVPALLRRPKPDPGEKALADGDFWAVRDVSFDIGPGQAMGIIGGNGAGKSTTLKLLTKILVPNRGKAEVRGRAGALIEVSAGFHPDLTGRENVFLQGAIMGMPQRLIRERFDDIVEFSGIAPFIDTPVKRYSSGMNARLGFSIAVHLEPDVLIVDEVLSVGDAEFQGRAFEKIRGMVRGNIPVVIVSHQLDRIVELCTECILLKAGEVAFQGNPRAAVDAYLHGTNPSQNLQSSDSVIGFSDLALHGPDPDAVPSGTLFIFRLSGQITDTVPSPDLHLELILLDAATNQRVFATDLRSLGVHPETHGKFERAFRLQANVPPGLYRMETSVWHQPSLTVVGQGPTRLFQVIEGRAFRGSHQLNIEVV